MENEEMISKLQDCSSDKNTKEVQSEQVMKRE